MAEPIDVDQAARERRRAMAYETATEAERSAQLDRHCARTGLTRDAAHADLVRPKSGRSELLEAAEAYLNGIPSPVDETVLVHGDLHLGNTMWIGDHLIGMVDWDAARVGSNGIDLGLARFDAILHVNPRDVGLDASGIADEVLAGWQHATGVRLDRHVISFWDLRAALNAPVDFGAPQDRQPERRDALVRSALNVLRYG
ncbi:aminoglycoside phosphotransferase (APT) family kinase protein [Microlunatus parietis]|uniref:Aminoglycoside phosphotransferase (APT) family kinase protein n=2 Tax=Microlunatus parietis TaxID=682979 RepID=A0A7Y9IF00_9ACTN|nr:aminoglycoside phosphotransferase (APT) family kinase protein [Microlunatus parietis]